MSRLKSSSMLAHAIGNSDASTTVSLTSGANSLLTSSRLGPSCVEWGHSLLKVLEGSAISL